VQDDYAQTIHHMKTKFRAFTSLALLLTGAISAFAQLPPEARERRKNCLPTSWVEGWESGTTSHKMAKSSG